jgi:ankyrin repeat protein
MGKKKSRVRGSMSAPATPKISEATIIEACRMGDFTKLRRFSRRGVRVRTWQPLMVAATCGFFDIVRFLIKELGADVNKAAAYDGRTVLIAAVDQDNIDTVLFLVKELGANVNQEMKGGATPLFMAAQAGHVTMVRCLAKDLDADVKQAMNDGASPLLIAAEKGFWDVTECLVKEFDADVNQADKKGMTPLYCAASKRHLNVVTGLVKELGADVDSQMHDGATPVHAAVQHGDLILVSCLVKEFSADINLALRNGITPLISAAYNNDQALIKHLVHNGACVRAESEMGTAVEILEKCRVGATAEEIAYLKVREFCANPGCNGGGIKRCAVCKATRYCGMACRVTHWPQHRRGCTPPAQL